MTEINPTATFNSKCRKQRPFRRALFSATKLKNTIEMSRELTPNEEQTYLRLLQRFQPDADTALPHTNLEKIVQTIKKLANKKMKDKFKVAKEQRKRQFIEDIGKHIENIMEGRIDSSTVLKFITKDDKLVTDPEEIKHCITLHYQKIFNNDKVKIRDENWTNSLSEPIPNNRLNSSKYCARRYSSKSSRATSTQFRP